MRNGWVGKRTGDGADAEVLGDDTNHLYHPAIAVLR